MKPKKQLHPWEITPKEAVQIQRELAPLIEVEDRLPRKIRLVAGADIAFEKNRGSHVFAGVVVIDLATGETVETARAIGDSPFPYVSGLLGFREVPHLLAAFENLTHVPDLVICDGQGTMHPRRLGLACHLGLLLDVPTIGCGKSRLYGKFDEPDELRGSSTAVYGKEGEVIGYVVRTRDRVKPLFVSSGHRVSQKTATKWILRLADRYRQPEPIRRADKMVGEMRKAYSYDRPASLS